jgi:hypothetical protein
VADVKRHLKVVLLPPPRPAVVLLLVREHGKLRVLSGQVKLSPQLL